MAADCCFYEKNTVVLASFLANVSVFLIGARAFFARIAKRRLAAQESGEEGVEWEGTAVVGVVVGQNDVSIVTSLASPCDIDVA